MPEGPLVANTADWIKAQLIRGHYPFLVNFVQFRGAFGINIETFRPALDQPLVDFFCKGKEYFFVFARPVTPSDPPTIDGKPNTEERIAARAHHGMEGHWSFEHPTSPANVFFRFDFSWDLERFKQTQTPDAYLYYINERFGQFEILPSYDRIRDSVMRLAGGFIGRFKLTKGEWLYNWSMLGKSRLLHPVLKDQETLCSGIGNYLLAEILYAAKLHPEILVGQLTEAQVHNLYDVCAYIIDGHYKKTLEKVIYQRKVSPAGFPITYLKKGQKIWYSPSEQVLPSSF